MKPTIVAFLLASLVVPAIFCCCFARAHYVGFRAGANWATLEGDDPASLEPVTRFVGGAVGVFALTDWLAFQPELLYSLKGAKGVVPVSFFGADGVVGTYELNYLEIPLLLRLTPPLNGRLAPYAFGGTAVSANTSAYAEAEFIGASPGQMPPDNRIDAIVTDGDLSLIVGAGIDFKLGKVLVEFDGRYVHGLIPAEETRRSVDPRNRVWSLSMGVLFQTGR